MQKNQNKISFAEKRLLFMSKGPEAGSRAETPPEPLRGRAKTEAERKDPKALEETADKKNEAEKAEKKAEVKDQKAADQKIEAISNPSDTLTALGYKKPKTELPKDFDYIQSVPKKEEEYKKFESEYLGSTTIIFESFKKYKPEDYKKLETIFKTVKEKLGVEVDQAGFEKKICEVMAIYAKEKNEWNPETLAKEAKCAKKDNFSSFPNPFMNSPNDVLECLLPIQKNLENQLNSLNSVKISDRQKAQIPQLLAKMGLMEGDKISAKTLEYLLAGNDLVKDITIMGIAENWERMKPRFGQLEEFLGKPIDEKSSLESLKLMAGDTTKLADFEAKTKNLLDAFEMFKGAKSGDRELTGPKILEIFGIEIKGEKINTVELVQNLPANVNKLVENLGRLTAKVEKITTTVNTTLEKFGGKLPGLNSLTSLLGENGLDEKMLKDLNANPNSLEEKILEKIKAKFPNVEEIKNIKTLDDLDKALGKYFETMEAQLDESILAIFTSGFEIKAKKPGEKPIKINFEKDKIEALLPKIRKQLLPILSESIAKQTKTPLLNASGEIDLKNVEKILGNDDKEIPGDKNIKSVLKFFNETKGDKAKVEEFINSKDPEKVAATKAVSDFCGNVFDTILNSQNPEIVEMRDEVAKIAPPELVEAMSKGMLEDTFKELQEAFKAGSIGGIFEALMNVVGKIMSKVGMFTDWIKGKVSPAANKLADMLEKTGNDDAKKAAAEVREWVAPKKPETPQQQLAKKLNAEFGFDAKDIETAQTQDFKMEELMGKDDKEEKKVDFAALKTKYKFTEGVKLEDLAKQIKETNKYSATENKANKVWDFLINLQTPPPPTKTETKK